VAVGLKVINVLPTDTPVTVPGVAGTVAIPVLALLHVPAKAIANVVVVPAQITLAPVIAVPGSELTVVSDEVLQPAGVI
jgi:hypothetical protein